MMTNYKCQVCDKASLQLVDGFSELPRVTSDCRQFSSGGDLTVCMSCGAVQKVVSERWLDEISKIYANYQAYELADGEEQLIFDAKTGQPQKRSTVIMQHLQDQIKLKQQAKIIDIGCGDGVTLAAMSALYPQWNLYGYELGANKQDKLEKIKGFQDLLTGEIADIAHSFDLITMVHSLEHFTNPLEILCELRSKLNDDGYLFVQVCNVEQNPFDLLVADHLMHFSPASLTNIASRAGLELVSISTDLVKKELSFICKHSGAELKLLNTDAQSVYDEVSAKIAWLVNIVGVAKEVSSTSENFGVFGTSIAASWLANELGDSIKFFVDEDPNRIGREYYGKPVLAPDDVPENANVYLALAPTLAEKLAEKFAHQQWNITSPAVTS